MVRLTRQAYGGTEVPVGRTQDSIKDVLRRHRCGAVGFIENWETNQVGFHFSYMGVDGLRMTVRLLIPIAPMDVDGEPIGFRNPEAKHRRERQVWRMLFHYVKNQMDAVEFGLRRFDQAWLNDIVLDDGVLIGDRIRESLSEGRIRLALPSPT